MTTEKIEICQKAASFVQEGDTIMIDAGSTTEHLSEFIPRKMRLSVSLLPSHATGYIRL